MIISFFLQLLTSVHDSFWCFFLFFPFFRHFVICVCHLLFLLIKGYHHQILFRLRPTIFVLIYFNALYSALSNAPSDIADRLESWVTPNHPKPS